MSNQVNHPKMNPTSDVVKGELYYLLTESANAMLRYFAKDDASDPKMSLSKFQTKYSESDNVVAREFCESLSVEIEKIFDLLESLDGFQLQQASTLFEEYENELERLGQTDEETRRNYLLALPYNIRKDIRSYSDELNQMVKRKSRSRKRVEVEEVGNVPASFGFMAN